MSFTPNPTRRLNLVKLMDFIALCSDGDREAWIDIQISTGVCMDQWIDTLDPATGSTKRTPGPGRALFRLACKKLCRNYLNIQGGLGVEFSSADNANEIAANRIVKIGRAVSCAAKTVDQLYDRHAGQLSTDQAKLLTAKQAFLSSMNVSSSLARRFPAK